ncbi:endonuclease [soil metagenome]
MPEGPSIIILKELVQQFKNKKVLDAFGNAAIDHPGLVNKKVIDFKSWGKHFLICFTHTTLRIHFLLFGSYSFNEQTKADRSLRLCLRFKNGTVYFYTCAIKQLDEKPNYLYDWSSDVMNDEWKPAEALKKLKALPAEMICDSLLDQEIFSGVGNIIKNEVLCRVKLHPKSITAKIPAPVLKQLIKEARHYSFEFLEWKKAGVLKKHWLAYHKKICSRCNLPIIKEDTGKKHRSSFYCANCQVLYK